MLGARRALAVVGLAVVFSVASASLGPLAPHAAPNAPAGGELSWDGCLASDGSGGCGDLPGTPLDQAQGVAVSPDGNSVYVASYGSNSIAHFYRGPQGQIGYDGCLNNDGSSGCGDLPGAPLTGAFAVAVSPDGKSVYVASYISDSIAHFYATGPQGQLYWGGCLANDGSGGCGDLPGTPLDSAKGVAVSPDGDSVYVTSWASDSIAHFYAGPQGQLGYDGCLNNDGSSDCGDLPGAPLAGAHGVAVSPDGNSVYVASDISDSIAHFYAAPQGQIGYDGCLNNDGSDGCGDLPGAPLSAASGVAVSPDGNSVYVTARLSDSIAHFYAAPQGQLYYDGCLANDGSQGCGDLPGAPIASPAGVAVSPDGNSVYVASHGSHSIAHFYATGPEGQISWDGCLANEGFGGCADLPGAPLDAAYWVAVSPDGKSVYVASFVSYSIAHLYRALGSPTKVGLASFRATQAGRQGVRVVWRTATELQTVGFNVWRYRQGKGVKVNRSLIRAKRSGRSLGATYTFVDRGTRAKHGLSYRLQLVDLNGRRSWYAALSARTS